MTTTTPARRTVHYATFDEVLADAERLVRAGATTSGNWSLAQILGHLAIGMEMSVEATPEKLPWPVPWHVRLLGRYIIKPWILKRGMPSGYRLPAAAENWAVPASGEDPRAALERLRRAVGHLRSDTPRCPHPVFGPMSADEWNRWHLRHAELHLSFVREPGS